MFLASAYLAGIHSTPVELRHLRYFVAVAEKPKRVQIGMISRKGKLTPAAEKFRQCATEAFAVLR